MSEPVPKQQVSKERQQEIEELVERTLKTPKGSNIRFDVNRGYVLPSDDFETPTVATLKEIVKALNEASDGVELSNDIYDDVEKLLFKYHVFVSEGIRETIGSHKNVSWYLTSDAMSGRAFINYQDGVSGEWFRECFADEVHLWLLRGLFRRIQLRKKCGDQESDEVIKAVDKLDDYFYAINQKRISERLTVSRFPGLTRRLNDGK